MRLCIHVTSPAHGIRYSSSTSVNSSPITSSASAAKSSSSSSSHNLWYASLDQTSILLNWQDSTISVSICPYSSNDLGNNTRPAESKDNSVAPRVKSLINFLFLALYVYYFANFS